MNFCAVSDAVADLAVLGAGVADVPGVMGLAGAST